jgi:hypothetical protein
MKLNRPSDFTDSANDVSTSRSHTHQTPAMQQSTGTEPKRQGEAPDKNFFQPVIRSTPGAQP